MHVDGFLVPGVQRRVPRFLRQKAIFGDAFLDELREIFTHRMPFRAAPPLALP
jgi:hypothetical protein